jgi:hypothetical protein
MTHFLTNAEAVINALGGTSETAKALSTPRRRYLAQHVNNWRAAERFPAYTYLKFRSALEAQGKAAPASLWGMAE